jgi:ElaB/YqjD/DUF883 family membrane-anchored ribosome-binding protein
LKHERTSDHLGDLPGDDPQGLSAAGKGVTKFIVGSTTMSGKQTEQTVEGDLRESIAALEQALAALTRAAKASLQTHACKTCRQTADDDAAVHLTPAQIPEAVRSYVTDRPVRSLAIAALVGCVFGLFCARRRT